MIDLTKPIDTNSSNSRRFLESVQGNILKGHGRDHTAHIFVQFQAEADEIRTWIIEFAQKQITSAAEQRKQTARQRANGGLGELFTGFLLCLAEYTALGVGDDRLPTDPFFRAGTKRHNEVTAPGQTDPINPINDPAPTLWKQGFRSDILAMMLLAHDNKFVLDKSVDALVDQQAGLRCASFVERGDKLIYDLGPPRGVLVIGHFGHQDGVLNPRMNREDIGTEVAERARRNGIRALRLV